MKKVTYRGTAHQARITGDQFKAVNVSSKDVTWSGYGNEQEVADEAADWLAKNDNRFEVEGAGDDSAYSRRLKTDATEQVRRSRLEDGVVAPADLSLERLSTDGPRLRAGSTAGEGDTE